MRGDVLYDGTAYDLATAAAFLIPMHAWPRVCRPAQRIIVEARDHGLLDENGILLDLSRTVYDLLFGDPAASSGSPRTTPTR